MECWFVGGDNLTGTLHVLQLQLSLPPPSPFIIISGFHYYECIAQLVANSLQSGQFWARLTASVYDSPWESRLFCTVFIRGRPGGLFQYTEGEEVKICLASILSSIQAICPNRVRHPAWIIFVSRGWLVWRRTSSLEPRSIWRHHRRRALRPAFVFLGNCPAL